MIGTRAAPLPRPSPPNWLVDEVLPRRVLAWCLDWVLIAVLAGGLWLSGFTFGLLTLGLGFGVLHLLPAVPLAYHWLSLVSPLSATPGQRMMDLVVRRDQDFGPVSGTEALISVLAFYATLGLGLVWLGLALFTRHNRTPHDLLAGLMVVRARALAASPAATSLTRTPPAWNTGLGGQFNA